MKAAIAAAAIGCMLLTARPAAAGPAPRPAATVVYRVKKGDTLSQLAARYLTTPNAAPLLARLNGLRDPRHLPADFALKVPIRLLRQEPVRARVHSFGGRVTVTVGGKPRSPTPGLLLDEGSAIETGANAFISLDLPDGTIVTMPSQSRMTIGRLRQTLLTGSLDRRFDIAAGRVRAVVTPMTDPRSNFRISTPVAVSAVRGTEFRVGYDPIVRRATTEVITGKVAVTGTGKTNRLVVAGYGAATGPAAGVSLPAALLPSPEPIGPTGWQRDPDLSFAVKPVPGAVGYRLQIARDAGFLDLLSETDSVQPGFTLPTLPDGTYFSRIAAIDAAGLEGRSDIFGFERRLHAMTTSMEEQSGGKRRQYLFRWHDLGNGRYVYRFQLARCGAEGTPIIDQANVADLGLVVSDLPVGNYCWRVQSIGLGDKGDAIWSDIGKFTIAN